MTRECFKDFAKYFGWDLAAKEEVTVHHNGDFFQELMRTTAREQWKVEYRAQRMRAKGYSEKEIHPMEGKMGNFIGINIVTGRK